ncbi:hypothetical protein M3Y94_01171700 [Aphelenchoides besseyi]|nr:hypothetical protein M3Y94_01171700 [Aphelenchoides besseyi]
MEEEAVEFEDDEFHAFIRTQVVCLILFLALYGISFLLIQYFKSHSDSDELYAGDEDFFVYRVSWVFTFWIVSKVWMCSCSLTVSIGALALLPFSVLGFEVLHSFPDNYYLKWLNWSLIITSRYFFFFRLHIFFIESQGFSFHRRPKPFLARVYETICVCTLVIVILVALAHVFYSLFLSEKLSAIFSVFDFSNLSVPLIYSLVSLVGVFLLLLSVPFGFAKMFDVTSKLLLVNEPEDPLKSPTFTSTIKDSYSLSYSTSCRRRNRLSNDLSLKDTPLNKKITICSGPSGDASKVDRFFTANVKPIVARASWIRRVFKAVRYPIAILILFNSDGKSKPSIIDLHGCFQAIVIFMVFINALQLLFGFRVLPEYVQIVEVRSRHRFGIPGAVVETIIIVYTIFSAFVGVYSMPLLHRMKPVKGATSISCVIANCATILLLSSALPVLARTLGITSFDLLGEYGRLKWISNFSLICSYNVLFAAASAFSLLNKFTSPIRVELLKRIRSLLGRDELPNNVYNNND